MAALREGRTLDSGVSSGPDPVSYRSGSSDWWPSGLGQPGAVGAQNDLRYAVFPEARRLVLDDHGTISIFDTKNHRIFRIAQAQSSDQTVSFTSQKWPRQTVRPP
jgi:hypothetical protein